MKAGKARLCCSLRDRLDRHSCTQKKLPVDNKQKLEPHEKAYFFSNNLTHQPIPRATIALWWCPTFPSKTITPGPQNKQKNAGGWRVNLPWPQQWLPIAGYPAPRVNDPPPPVPLPVAVCSIGGLSNKETPPASCKRPTFPLSTSEGGFQQTDTSSSRSHGLSPGPAPAAN